MFQSTHPRGVRRTRRRRQSRLSQCFNPRTRVGCDSPPTNRIFAAQEFQSTHPRGVRLAALLGLSIRVTVSIHAPAWGATTSIWQARNSRPVSIHAPAWGATCRHVRQRACLRVSIHAPAWGATPAQPAAGTTAGRFQSTHPRGVRLALIMGLASINKFQSTHPRGVRQQHGDAARDGFVVSIHAPAWGATASRIHRSARACCFNPRTRVGCDLLPAPGHVAHAAVSIHAPAWGATVPPSSGQGWRACFNPRTRVGCDLGWIAILAAQQGFNPRTRVGCDPRCCSAGSGSGRFQSTHPRGVRHLHHHEGRA